MDLHVQWCMWIFSCYNFLLEYRCYHLCIYKKYEEYTLFARCEQIFVDSFTRFLCTSFRWTPTADNIRTKEMYSPGVHVLQFVCVIESTSSSLGLSWAYGTCSMANSYHCYRYTQQFYSTEHNYRVYFINLDMLEGKIK